LESIKTPTATSEEDKKLLEAAADEIEQISAARDKIAAEWDQAQAERDQLMDVLKLPSAKHLLRETYFPDKHPKATENAKRAFDDYSKTINAAYDLIKQDDRARKSDDAA